MKSYLSLIPISAKIHKRQNRMTLLCIMIAVFLVTAIFSIADMCVRMEKTHLVEKHGNWQIAINNISEEQAAQIGARSDIAAASWYGTINQDMEADYHIQGKSAVLCGAEKDYLTKIRDGIKEGSYPEAADEILLSQNAKTVLGINIGDLVKMNTPGGEQQYKVTGFGGDDSIYENQNYVVCAFISMKAYHSLREHNDQDASNPIYYIQLSNNANVQNVVDEIKNQYGVSGDDITENTAIMGISGSSSNSTMQGLYTIAIVLFILIMIAGALMISGSINSNVAQRTKFFGMMRCIGASRRQIIHFVRLEALNWCKTAIPIGVIAGLIMTWAICAVLRFGVGGELSDMPLFGFSKIGVFSGVLVGVVTVLLAAQSPAKHAAKVSPVAAVAGETGNGNKERKPANTKLYKIETALGIHHAVSAKKNLVLMTGSFALSILLFLLFCVGLDTVHALLPSLRSWQPDCTMIGYENACSIDREVADKISQMPGVKRVSGNIFKGNLPVTSNAKVDHVNLVSYDDYMLGCARDSLVSGSMEELYDRGETSNSVITIFNKDNPLETGDTVEVNGTQLNVTGVISDGLFADGITLICSEETFTRLMGKQDYAMLCIQLNGSASDTTITAISALAGDNNIFTDQRDSNTESTSMFWAFRILAYCFLAIITLITVLNIVNSTSMSVSARMKQYGAMRAVGMDCRQLIKMITTEVVTYAFCGCVIGCIVGIPLNRILYEEIITSHFGNDWTFPYTEVLIILAIVILSVVLAIYRPAKRMKNMVITDTINEL